MQLFAFFRAELLVIIVISDKKRTNLSYKQYCVKLSRHFYHISFKLKTRRNLNLTIFRRSSLEIICMKNYFVTTSALNFKQLYIFYKYYPIKRTFLSERTRYFVQAFNCSSSHVLT